MYCRTVQGQLCGNIWKPTPRRNTSVHVSPCPSSTEASSKPTGSWCLTPILLRFVERLKQVMWCPRGQFCWWLDNSNTSHKLCYFAKAVLRQVSAANGKLQKTLSDNGTSNTSNQWNLWIQYNSISYHDSCTHFFSCSDGAQSISNPLVSICDSTSNFFDHSLFSRLHSSEFPDFAWALFADWDDWVIVQGLESLLSGLSGTFHDWNRVNEAT